MVWNDPPWKIGCLPADRSEIVVNHYVELALLLDLSVVNLDLICLRKSRFRDHRRHS